MKRIVRHGLVAGLWAVSLAACAGAPVAELTLDLNRIHKWHDSNGDTWDPFWADDDQLYTFNCDGRGFGRQPRNLAFHVLTGGSMTSLVGRLVNSMDEYGKGGQKEADGATWKVMGQECVDAVFYGFVSRHLYGKDSGDPLMRQTAFNASLIKSTDRGLTWTRGAAENYANPMWPGKRFGAPFFIHYGRNGGQTPQDGADRFVYALSNNGFWNGGDDYILARVPRDRIAGLNAADWTYFTGGDGLDAKSWSEQIALAAPILSLPAQCGSGPACHVPALGVYLLVAWYIPTPLKKWFEPKELKYDFYQAAHPWGPWKLTASVSDRFLVGGHMYGPSLCAKFQGRAGEDVILSLITSGCPFEDKPVGLYKMWEIPVILRTTPAPPLRLVNNDDPAIVYRGGWLYGRPGRGFHDHGDDIHYSTNTGASAEFTFEGTGLDYLSEKYADHGRVAVHLDGQLRAVVDLALANFPRLAQVAVFSVRDLPPGRHTLKLVNQGADYAILDAFRVYGGASPHVSATVQPSVTPP